MDRHGVNRRGLLGAGAAAAATAGGTKPAAARVIEGGEPWAPHQADAPQPIQAADYVFFTPREAAVVEAATERLIPGDDVGPGAKACGVTLFIDHQLAGAYGRAQSWYMQGPWAKGADTQGFQSRYAPADMYRAAIKGIEAHVAATQNGRGFETLPAAAQDALLSDMEAGKLTLDGVDGQAFFKLLLMDTKQGMFSDPIYGGNKDMAGWKMLGFPEARYDYRQ